VEGYVRHFFGMVAAVIPEKMVNENGVHLLALRRRVFLQHFVGFITYQL
jgi:hypothetical protein